MSKTILHIAEASGGVERYLVTLLKKMKKYKKFEHILVCSSSFDKDKFEGLVKHLSVVEDMHNAISFFSDIKSIIAVRHFIKYYKPNIIYCHSSKAGAIGRIANIGLGCKLIYNAHGWAFNMKGVTIWKTTFYEIVEKLLALFSDRIVCISEFEKISALEHGICSKSNLVVINNGIDFDEFKSVHPISRRSLGIPDNAFIIGTIGRLSLQKAPDIFVKMAIEIKQKIDNAFFIMVGDDLGDGTFRKMTECLIRDSNLTNSFLITGWVDSPLNYGALFDVAVLLSRWEGFGLVVPEYMFMQKPIVATNVDAIPYVLGNAGIVVPIDDYKSASVAVFDLFNNKLVKQLKENCKERVIMFDAQMTADKHVKLFNLLCQENN